MSNLRYPSYIHPIYLFFLASTKKGSGKTARTLISWRGQRLLNEGDKLRKQASVVLNSFLKGHKISLSDSLIKRVAGDKENGSTRVIGGRITKRVIKRKSLAGGSDEEAGGAPEAAAGQEVAGEGRIPILFRVPTLIWDT